MKSFPKKYNYKNINNNKKNNLSHKYDNTKTNNYSALFPSDQKIHPGCVFSLFFQDLVYEIDNIKGIKNNRNVGFGMTSNFYSKLNDASLDILQLQAKFLKQSKQNQKFFDKLGLGCNITPESFVMTEEFNRYMRDVFVNLYQNNKILSKKEISLRSKDLQTNLSKNNILIKNQDITEYSIKYFVDSKGHALTIPTTSLETIFADVAVAVNPQDKRYKKLIGKEVIIPIINKVIPVIGDEAIDSFQGSGVFRVTPGHDQLGLELAQKHHLPLDIFAVDIHGNFTEHAGEFAGKPVKDFFDNIVKYIDDIGNLESKKIVQEDKNFNLHTGEILDHIMLNQRSIQYSYSLDYLYNKLLSEDFSIISSNKTSCQETLIEELNDIQSINISNKSKKGVLVPILNGSQGDFFAINDAILLDKYKSLNTRKSLSLTLIILNLILDNQLQTSFSIEELISVLFSSDLKGEKTKLEKYIDIYNLESIKSKDKRYKIGLKDIEKLLGKIESDNEKIQLFTDMLQNSFAININDDLITLDFSIIFKYSGTLLLKSQDGFNKSFVNSVRYLYANGLSYSFDSYENIETSGGILSLCDDQKDFALNTQLLGLEYSRKLLFSGFRFHPSLVDIKGNKIVNSNSKFLIQDFSKNIATYGPDAMRLVLLFADKYDSNKLSFDTYKIQEYSYILNKIRNASRYVYSNYILGNNKKIKIQTLINSIQDNITDYDLWIIHSIKTILDDYEYQLGENRILELGSKMIAFCKDMLCDKYLESTKLNTADNTANVIILSFILVLRLIRPYIPSLVGEIESIFNVDRGDYNIFDFREHILNEKNYKINLFMDIVDKLKKLKVLLGAKKHETVDIFVQANTEFLGFLFENKELLDSLVNISEIESIKLHEDIPQGYEIDNVININLGVKTVVQEEVRKDILVDMEEKYVDKLEHLQHMKSLVASVSKVGNEDIINQKRKEISILQAEIEDLNFEIRKLKIR